MSFRRWGMSGLVALVGALGGVAGCVEDNGSMRDAESAGAAQAALAEEGPGVGEGLGGRPGRRPPGPPGPDHLLVAALHELDLSDAQVSAIEGALETLRAEKERTRPEGGAPFAALAEGVRAGKIDVAAVVAKAPSGEPFAGARDAMAKALETLHATLTKAQRQALVEGLEARFAAHAPGGPGKAGGGPPGERAGGPPGPPPAHALHAGQRHERAGAGPEHAGPPPGGPLGHLLGRLDLDEAQQEAIARILEADAPAAPDHEAMKKRFEAVHVEMRARLQGFVADAFDAKAFLAPPADAKGAGPASHLERMAKTLSAVVPLLDPAQRETLAKALEQGPRSGPHPAFGKGGPRGAQGPQGPMGR
ncbi:Spy/CpxP family protein refolding chaperone [Chondromyces crocatus]|uniref:Uncharacterized protein n=1 Tax=Chondromyces crocatus TaxID=52 RepID=A0A0K1E9Y8_CHOCO|nr:Spy/CpxP family protein refolding chaperone [Chondromyces crocatus]AKT37691.1 uncharacterized protein CMC5_018330 [Chondromyces crocatus]